MASATFNISVNGLEHTVDVVSRENEMLKADVKRLTAAFQNELRLNTDKSVKIAVLEADLAEADESINRLQGSINLVKSDLEVANFKADRFERALDIVNQGVESLLTEQRGRETSPDRLDFLSNEED